MASLERLPNQILVSNAPDPKAALFTAFWGTRQVGRFMEKVGSDGVEAMPTRWLSLEINYGLASIEESGIIAGHLSPREKRESGPKPLKEYWKRVSRPPSIDQVGSWVVFAESARSYQTLTKLQKELKTKTGRDLPVVFYPTAPKRPWEESEEEANRFSQVLFQLCPEVIKIWRVKTVADLLTEMKKRCYTGICYDTIHSRCPPEDTPDFSSDWRKFLPEVLDQVKEVHVSAGRLDITQAKIDTMGELEGLFNPEQETELNWILWELYERDWSGRVVIEVPSRALAQRRQRQFMTSEQLVDDYRAIIANVRGILIEGVYPPARLRKNEAA